MKVLSWLRRHYWNRSHPQSRARQSGGTEDRGERAGKRHRQRAEITTQQGEARRSQIAAEIAKVGRLRRVSTQGLFDRTKPAKPHAAASFVAKQSSKC